MAGLKEPNRGRRPETPEGKDLQRQLESIRGAMSDDRRAAADQRVVVGMSVVFPNGVTVPSGWLRCDGTAVSRRTYRDLFTMVGETHGSGDGSTTFDLPDFSAEDPTLGRWYIWTGVES